MDVEVKGGKNESYFKDEEIKLLIKRSQEGDQSARDLIIEKICVWSGRSYSGLSTAVMNRMTSSKSEALGF